MQSLKEKQVPKINMPKAAIGKLSCMMAESIDTRIRRKAYSILFNDYGTQCQYVGYKGKRVFSTKALALSSFKQTLRSKACRILKEYYPGKEDDELWHIFLLYSKATLVDISTGDSWPIAV